MKLRGYAALGVVSVGLLAADIVQRLVIAPWIRLRPSRRIEILTRWQRLMAWFVLSATSRIGGANHPPPPVQIPAGPGQLILMNHQSLFDIPLVVSTVVHGYPRIVTRERYGRSIPLISHMTRLYQYPFVNPRANKEELREMLDSLTETGREADVPIVVFPEGSRTADGHVGRFKTAGVAALLRARCWTVHLVAVDGYWEHARLPDLARKGFTGIHGRLTYAGSIEWTDPEGDPRTLINEAQRRMATALNEARALQPGS